MQLTDAQIKHMVNRFLGWRLPENFAPDAGISFKPTFNDHLPRPSKHQPSGTNLFNASQAEAMIRHLIEGLPTPAVCMDCCEAPATVADLYCADCIQVMADNHEFAQDNGQIQEGS